MKRFIILMSPLLGVLAFPAYSSDPQYAYEVYISGYKFYSSPVYACDARVSYMEQQNNNDSKGYRYLSLENDPNQVDEWICTYERYWNVDGSTDQVSSVVVKQYDLSEYPHLADQLEPDPVPDGQGLANQECEAIKPLFVSLPDGLAPVGETFSWDYNGCTFTTNAVWIQQPSGNWSAVVGSAEAIQPDPDTIDENVSEIEVEGGTDATPYFGETANPATDCPHSNYSYGGQTYCYFGEDAPSSVNYVDGSERVDHYDGSFDIVAPDGTTTSYTPEGGIADKTTAPDTADGEEYGEGDDGILKALVSLKKSVNDGFDGLVDKMTSEFDEAGNLAGVDGAIADYEATIAADETDLEASFDSEVSEQTGQSVIDMLPTFSGFACTDINFAFGEHVMTIKCENFSIFRQMFAFLIYCYTAISLVELFFNSSRQKGTA